MVAPALVVCWEKLALLKAYEQAALAYSADLTHLRSSMGTSPQEEYAAAYRNVELLRMDARMAQERLEVHAEAHGC